MTTVGIIGILVAMVLFLFLVYKGHSVFWVAPLMGTLIAVTNTLNPVTAFVETFATGVTQTIVQNWSLYLLGAILAKIITDCGGSVSIANAIVKLIVAKRTGYAKTRAAVASMVILFSLLTVCGISGTVLAFTLFPIVIAVFELADIPRRFVPAALLCGCGVMACPGAPVFYNVFVSSVLKTPSTSGLVPGLIAVVFIVLAIFFMLSGLIIKAQKNGEHFEYGELTPMEKEDPSLLPNPIVSLLPLVAVFVTYAVFKLHIAISLTIGIVLAIALLGRNLMRSEDGKVKKRTPNLEDIVPNKKSALYRFCAPMAKTLSQGSVTGANSLMMVGFPAGISAVVASTAAFGVIVAWLGGINMNPLLLTMILVCVIVAITASPPAAITMALPIIMQMFISNGAADPMAVHRIAAFAVSTFETLPCNGLVLISLGMAKTNHKQSYLPIFLESVVFTFAGTLIVTFLLMLFPGLA